MANLHPALGFESCDGRPYQQTIFAGELQEIFLNVTIYQTELTSGQTNNVHQMTCMCAIKGLCVHSKVFPTLSQECVFTAENSAWLP